MQLTVGQDPTNICNTPSLVVPQNIYESCIQVSATHVSFQVVTVNDGLPGLRHSDDLSGIHIPDISDGVCVEVKRSLQQILLRTTFSSNNQASKGLQMYQVNQDMADDWSICCFLRISD